ncbi:MAG: tail fiber domain-containing protein [Chitinophagaceae bacterium]|nr:tail fiber domain-containing protein [Chitinophagaceae bacterium]
MYAQNGTINTSDVRDKQNIKPIAYGLESLMKLNPVSYEWKNGSIGSGAKLGLIAQEVMKVIPEVVKTHETIITDEASKQTMEKEMDRYGIYYSDLIPLLIKSIQEQQQKITTLEARLKALEDKLK